MSGQADWRIEPRRNPLPCSGRPHKTVRLPRWRRAASYAAQLVTRCRCLGMRGRRAAFALNGTADVRRSWKGPLPYVTRSLSAPRVDPCNNADLMAALTSTARSARMLPDYLERPPESLLR